MQEEQSHWDMESGESVNNSILPENRRSEAEEQEQVYNHESVNSVPMANVCAGCNQVRMM